MPRTRSLAWSELKIGVVAIAAAVFTTIMIVAVGGEGGYFWQRYPLKVKFVDVLGLKPGAVVRLSGKEIGTVTEVQFTGGPEVEVWFEAHKEVRPLLTTTSLAQIGSISLLGEPIIDITGGAGGRPLEDWGYVRAAPPAGSFATLTSTASTSLAQIDQLLADVRAGKGTLGRLVTDDALYSELQALVTSAGDVTEAINRGRGTLGGLINDPAAYNALRASLANLQTMTERINSGNGALGRFLNDEAMGRSLAGTMSATEQITGRLSKGEGTAGKLLTDQQLYDRLNSMAGRVDQVVAGLESGQGTAGQLLRDEKLYENMNGAVLEIRDLVAEIKKDPRKYLRVNVSIF
jgi:phospholipid/cholesterol/gamma-HCH transport system substrate-binding protein